MLWRFSKKFTQSFEKFNSQQNPMLPSMWTLPTHTNFNQCKKILLLKISLSQNIFFSSYYRYGLCLRKLKTIEKNSQNYFTRQIAIFSMLHTKAI